MSQSTARHALPFIQPAQAQKHVTHNEALEQLDLLVQLNVESFDASAPPNLREDGQIWALAPVPSGEWDGQGGRLAAWVNGAWVFVTPQTGWRAALGTELRIWSGSEWRAPDLPDLQNIAGLGIQTSFDAINRLAVASEATLLTHDGGGHQLKINKADSSETASLLFQTSWSGRAEMGTAGSDSWSLKVSEDGNIWREALSADPATGQVTIPEGLSVSGALALPSESLELNSAVFAGQLPVTHGGTGATTAAGARSALGLGSAATADVTTSAIDATSGRVLKVGDFGLGATVPPEPADMNDITFGSLFGGGSNTLNAPLSPAFSAISLMGQNASNGAQLVVHQGPERVFFRARAGGGFKPWQEFYTRLNVVGDVSQAGGLPTGAIIQQGSNSNGEFVRFADGTQICWVSGFSVSGSGAPSWTYPAEFAAFPRSIAGNVQNATTPAVLTFGASIGAASGPVRVWNLSGSRVTENVSLIAVGRWF